LISNAIGTQIIEIEKRSKQIGKVNRWGNIAKLFGTTAALPFLIPQCVNDMLPVVSVAVVFNFTPRLSCSVGVQEKEAFNRFF